MTRERFSPSADGRLGVDDGVRAAADVGHGRNHHSDRGGGAVLPDGALLLLRDGHLHPRRRAPSAGVRPGPRPQASGAMFSNYSKQELIPGSNDADSARLGTKTRMFTADSRSASEICKCNFSQNFVESNWWNLDTPPCVSLTMAV